MTEKKPSTRGKKTGTGQDRNSSKSKPTTKPTAKPAAKTGAAKTAAKKSNGGSKPATTAASVPTVKTATSSPNINNTSSEELTQLIAERAYYLAEQRGFSGGDPVEDWLVAEREVKNSSAA